MKDKAPGKARAGKKPARKPASSEVARRRPAERAQRSGPKTTPVRKPSPPKNAKQAKARAKARKAKAPKIVRPPLRDRLIARIAAVDLRPRALAARVPFVVLVIGSLGVGLGATLWLSTYSAERSYELGSARETNRLLMQQKESLERDVLEAQAAPALAEAARNLGMIPSRDTAHLVQDATGNWVVVGTPRPAEGTPPPPLNVRLPDENAQQAPTTSAAPQGSTVPPQNSVEVPVRVPSPAETARVAPQPQAPQQQAPVQEQPVQTEQVPGDQHAPNGAAAPGPALPGPAPVEVAPAPVDAAPAPVEVAPAPVDVAPAPVEVAQ